MTNSNEKLTDRQKQALPHFLTCVTYEDGCKQAGISKTTLYEWLKNPIFKSELNSLRNKAITEAMDTLRTSTTKAVQKLVQLLDIENNPSLVRIVANDILTHVMKFRELQDIETRIEQLEAKVSHG